MSAAADLVGTNWFWLKEGVNEEILLEILARLPNSLNVVQAGLVCHLWHSLIFQQHFIPRFIGLREQKKIEQPYSIIFRIVDSIEFEYDDGDDSDEYYQPICKLFSEEDFAGDSWRFRMPIYCSKSRQWSDDTME
ncbi:unnamed protein product [Cuscuta epithymum]|nr:unnamed protein product [Cuscuta epithymum]